MSYIGENSGFSFIDNFCEPLSDDITSAFILGRTTAYLYKKIAVCCDESESRKMFYAVCTGISDGGSDVFMCEESILPAFRHIISIISADCGIYVSKKGKKISFFDKSGFPLCRENMIHLMSTEKQKIPEKCGEISEFSSVLRLYSDSISDELKNVKIPLNAKVNCGNKKIRSLWEKFFDSDDDEFIFQVSDDGSRVNAYGMECGFISYERLILSYAAIQGEDIYIPDTFHYAADNIAGNFGFMMKRYVSENGISGVNQRFLRDSLFLCTQLLSDMRKFYGVIRRIPAFSSAVRETGVDVPENFPVKRIINEKNGRVILYRSGRNRIGITAQAYESETAAELCAVWEEKLKRQCYKKR